MNLDDPKLTAYALGELTGEERQIVEDQLRDDPEARAFVEETKAFARMLSGEFHAELPPAQLAPEQRAEVMEQARGEDDRKIVRFNFRAWTLRIAAGAVLLGALAQFVIAPAFRHTKEHTTLAQQNVVSDEAAKKMDDYKPATDLFADAKPSETLDRKETSGLSDQQSPTIGSKIVASASSQPLVADQAKADATGNAVDSLVYPAKGAPATAAPPPLIVSGGTLSLTQDGRNVGASNGDASKSPRGEAKQKALSMRVIDTKTQSQVGYEGQAFGTGTPVNESAAAPMAPVSRSAPLAATNDALKATVAPAGTLAQAETDKTKGIDGVAKGQKRASAEASAAAAAGKSSSNSETPALLREGSFNSATLAQAVNHFVAIGKTATIQELDALAKTAPGDSRTSERIGWLCRILFTPKGSEPLRQPLLGGLNLPWKSMPLTRWPLYPVAPSGSSYFVLSEGYILAGAPEPLKDYLDYCRAKGDFRKTPVPVPTREQALRDAKQLRQSAAWKAIQWKESGQGFSYSFDETHAWQQIEKQAADIPEK